jgi:glycosyltransferase involved in cell wall biosynthesis
MPMMISIVIPAYNEEALLGRCLEAVLAEVKRSAVECEVVVVDNASTDGTAGIAREYPGVRLLAEPQRSIVRARARGLAETSGELVANIDADTVMPTGWLDTVAAEFSADPGLMALSGPVYFEGLSAWQQVLMRLAYRAAFPLYLLTSSLGLGSIIQGGNFVFRRSAWLAAGGYDPSIEFYGEDTNVARRLVPLGRVKWTFDLPMVASGRRFVAEGLARTTWRYAVSFIAMTFAGRAVLLKHVDIRQPGER